MQHFGFGQPFLRSSHGTFCLVCGALVAMRQDAEEELVLLKRLIKGVVWRDAAAGKTKRWMKIAWLTQDIGMAFLLPSAISWTRCNRCS